MDKINEIKDKISNKQAIIIVGTGFSAFTAGNDGANQCSTWNALIRNGIDHVTTVSEEKSEDWKNATKSLLDIAKSTADMISVASQVKSALLEISQVTYSNWLRDTVGNLKAKNHSLGESLRELGIPILTTNYDKLLEETTGYPTTTWKYPDKLHECYLNNENFIGHLHGVFDEPDDVIFSDSDYSLLLKDDTSRYIENSLYSNFAFIYIGYGEGFNDPNFSKLIDENIKRFPNSNITHYQLCRESDLSDQIKRHAKNNIEPVSYGETYDDLPEFIASLKPTLENYNQIGPSYSIARLIDTIRESLITGNDSNQNYSVEDIVLAPVLLPMSHEQYIAAHKISDDSLEKININSINYEDSSLLVVGDELSGLTTCLQYLILKSSQKINGAYPVYIDTRKLSQKYSLKRLINDYALNNRIISKPNDTLPPIALALDNLAPRRSAYIENLLNSVREINCKFVVFGCRNIDQPAINQEFNSCNYILSSTLYLGKFGQLEVQKLTDIVSPNNVNNSIAETVLEIASREHLPRTPFNLALLVSLVINAKKQEQNYKSETALLEDYIKLVLNRFDNNQHIDLDIKNRETILMEIAEYLILKNKSSDNKSDVLKVVENTNKKYGWGIHSSQTLDSLIACHLLREHNDNVGFHQSAYLHFFAAKSAGRNESNNFRDKIFSDPLYYSPILRHYAALVRNSDKLLIKMQELLNAYFSEKMKGRTFQVIGEKYELPSGDLYEIEDAPHADDNSIENHSDKDSMELNTPGLPENIYHPVDDTDIDAFPFEDLSKFPKLLVQNHILEFSSRVLRDSDEIPIHKSDSPKISLLLQILNSWGNFIDYFETDEQIKMLVSETVDSLSSEFGDSVDERSIEIKDRINWILPTIVVLSGMSRTLKSSKLKVTHQQLIEFIGKNSENDEIKSHSSIMTFLFSYLLDLNGWSKQILELNKTHGDIWFVNNMIASLMRADFVNNTLSSVDEENVKNFIRECYGNIYKFNDSQHKEFSTNLMMRSLFSKKMENKSKTVASVNPLRTIRSIVE